MIVFVDIALALFLRGRTFVGLARQLRDIDIVFLDICSDRQYVTRVSCHWLAELLDFEDVVQMVFGVSAFQDKQ